MGVRCLGTMVIGYAHAMPLAEIDKLGPNWQGGLFIPLGHVPHHYLVLVMRHNDFDYALITTEDKPQSLFYGMNIIDVAWLDVNRICAGENLQTAGVGG